MECYPPPPPGGAVPPGGARPPGGAVVCDEPETSAAALCADGRTLGFSLSVTC